MSRVAIASLLMVYALLGCSKKNEVAERGGPERGVPRTAPPVAPPEPEWKRITTFAQSLESISLEVDAADRKVTLSFSYQNVDELDGSGIPYHTYVSGLTGTLNAAGEARLENPAVTAYEARISCPQPSCANATLTLEHLQGKRLKGRAEITKRTHTGLGKLTMHTTPTNEHSASKRISNELRAGQGNSTNTLGIIAVRGGRTFYSASIELSNRGMQPNDEGYFEKKWVAVFGTTGEKQHARVVLYERTRGLQLSDSYPVEANAEYHERFERISIRFNDTSAIQHSFFGLIVGRKVILTPEDLE